MSNHAIHTQGLSRSFGTVQAVDALSLTVERGEVFGCLGHNGAGKTTTVRLLNGVLSADAGTATVLGFNPHSDGPALRRRTGVLTETASLDERLTATENLRFYAALYDIPMREVLPRVTTALDTFGLHERADDKVAGYSKGMKQRLALARAFLHQPELIFLDEPTAGLDPIATQDVREMIRQASRDEGRTVFLCTHNLVEAQRLCDRVGVMERGRLVAVGTPAELARDVGVGSRYHIEIAPEQGAATQAALQAVHGIQQVTFDETGLHLTVAEREAVPDVLATLHQAGVRVYAATPLEASLEDIYVALHQRQEVPA